MAMFAMLEKNKVKSMVEQKKCLISPFNIAVLARTESHIASDKNDYRGETRTGVWIS